MALKSRKIAVMGFRAVGKSSLVIQFVEGQFVDSYEPTIESTFEKRAKFRGQDFRIQLVDTAGQDEYSIVPESYTMDLDGYVLVYSVTSMKSFDVVKIIYEKILNLTGTRSVPIILVGNKSDLHMQRVVTLEMGRKLASDYHVPFLESSAKQNEGVDMIFQRLLEDMEKGPVNDQCLLL
eukprot:Em0007g1462a